MPSPSDREKILDCAHKIILWVCDDLSAEVASSLRAHLESFLWNIECLINAAPDAVNLEEVVPGFGLLVCKSKKWNPSMQAEGCEAIPSPQLDVICQMLGKVATSILPDTEEVKYQHFETEDGLICALYRMKHKNEILASAGRAVQSDAFRAILLANDGARLTH